MIRELSEFGELIRAEKSKNERLHLAFKQETISIELVIHEDGGFEKFQFIGKLPTNAEAVTAKKGKARLLLDRAEEVLCYGGEESQKKHQLFLEKLKLYSDLKELAPVVKFYGTNRGNGLDRALQSFEKDVPSERERKGNIAFRLFGKSRIHEEDAVYAKIIELHNEAQETSLSKHRVTCSVCGQNAYAIPDIHEKIKGVPPYDDGMSAARSLISYNDNAYESYALRRNRNSSICAKCAKNYVEGLNVLLDDGVFFPNKKNKEDKRYRYRWPRTRSASYGVDTAMVFWTRKNAEVEEIEFLEEPKPEEVATLIESIASGQQSYFDPDQFYSCTLSGAAARIDVRDWIETSLTDVRKSIAKWFQDIAISDYDFDLKKTKIHYARLYDLARSCQRKNNDGKNDKDDSTLARVAANLWDAALKGNPPPLWILTKVIQRAQLDHKKSDGNYRGYGVTADRAALIKLILNRHNKGGSFMIKEKIMEGSRPIAYICGQVFAKMESIQYWAASGDRNAGIRERYFTYAMTLPSAAFGRLFDLSSKHYRKVKSENPGLATNLDKELQSLVKDIDIGQLPAIFSLEEKGQFAIGYYHQRQKQFENSKSKEKKEAE